MPKPSLTFNSEELAYQLYLRCRVGTDDWNDSTTNSVNKEYWRKEANDILKILDLLTIN